MIQETSGVYQLQFWRTFGAPVGAILEYAGMAKWLYRDPSTGETLSFSGSQANSYARDTGGMKGTHWKVIGVVKEGADLSSDT